MAALTASSAEAKLLCAGAAAATASRPPINVDNAQIANRASEAIKYFLIVILFSRFISFSHVNGRVRGFRSIARRASPTLRTEDRKSTRLNSSHLGISY